MDDIASLSRGYTLMEQTKQKLYRKCTGGKNLFTPIVKIWPIHYAPVYVYEKSSQTSVLVNHKDAACTHIYMTYLEGSVRQNAASCSPLARDGKYLAFCASFPAMRIP